MRAARGWAAVGLVAMGCACGAVVAAVPCVGAKGDISKETALFAQVGTHVSAGKDPRSGPALAIGSLYQIELVPQDQVRFALPPGRSGLTDGYAGVATLKPATEGSYRVSVDSPLWLDVVGNGSLAAVHDFQALKDCDAPRKIVEFELTGAKSFLLQLSGSARTTVRLTVTPVSPPKT